jgi:(p)ppGpp synthase/HD superfamily hydrolase
MNSLEQKSKEYAILCHGEVNHKYGNEPYEVHLQMVVDIAKQFIHLIPEEYRDKVLAACWGHDIIEDARQTYNDVVKILGEEVAEIIYAVTDELGRNRKERAEKTYPKIAENPFAKFVKECDRAANTAASKEQDSDLYEKYKKEYRGMYKKYKLEYTNFRMWFNNGVEDQPLWDFLDELNEWDN